VNFTVTFSENVTGVDVSDFIATNATASSVSGAGKVYTVTVNTGNAAIRLDVADDDTIIDVASNPLNGGFTAGATYQIATPPNVPAFDATSFANNALVVDYTPTFNWATVASQLPTGIVFDHYQLQVSAGTLFNTTVADVNIVGRTNSLYTLPVDLAPNTKFYWRLRSVNAHRDASLWSRARYFRAAMFPPVLLLPTNGAVFDNKRPTFTWAPVTGATAYTIQFSTVSGFVSIYRTVPNVTSPHTLTADLAGGATYYWRVRAEGINGPGNWSVAPTPKFTTGNAPSIPVLALPAVNALTTNYTPLFDWANSTLVAGTSFDHYQIQIASDATFASIVLDNTTAVGVITASSYVPSIALPSNANLYWRVRSHNTVGQFSVWSVMRPLRTAILPPVLTSPTNASLLNNKRPSFTWNSVSGATSYTIEVSTVNTFATKVVNVTVAATSYAPATDLLASATYYWRVKANAAAGNNGPSGYSATATFTTGNPPAIPVLQTPINAALVTTGAQTLNWGDVITLPAVVNYEYQVATDNAFNSIVDSGMTGVTSQATTIALLPGRAYYWHVRSWGATDHSAWSPAFTVKIRFVAPTLALPSNGATGVGSTPTFAWDDLDANGLWSSYTLQVANNAAFTVNLRSFTIPAPSMTYAIPLPALTNGLKYWRVRINGLYAPIFSATQTFTP